MGSRSPLFFPCVYTLLSIPIFFIASTAPKLDEITPILPIIDPYDANILSPVVATQYPPDAKISFVKKYTLILVVFLNS